jgi:multiple sugar transport system substrate-binding protein
MFRILRKLVMAGLLLMLLPHLSAAQGTLEFWSFIDPAGDSPRSKMVAEVIRSFEQKNPGVKIHTTIMAWNQIDLALLKGALAERLPDIAMVNSGRIQREITANALRPLDPYLAKLAASDRDDLIIPSSDNRDGKHYAIPYDIRVYGYHYRQDLLEKAGLKTPTGFDELVAAAKKMQELQGPGFVGIGMGFDPSEDGAEKFFVPAVVTLGGPILHKDGTADFATPEAIRMVTFVRDLVQKDKVLPLDVGLTGPDQVRQLTEAGRTGFFFEGSHWLLSLREKQKPGVKLNFMPVPTFGGGSQPGMIEAWNLGIPVGSKQPDLAWKLIQHWTSPEIQLQQVQKVGYLPVRRSLANDPALATPDMAHVRMLVKFVSDDALKFDWPENVAALQDALGHAIVNVMAGKQTPEAALKAAETDYNKLR